MRNAQSRLQKRPRTSPEIRGRTGTDKLSLLQLAHLEVVDAIVHDLKLLARERYPSLLGNR